MPGPEDRPDGAPGEPSTSPARRLAVAAALLAAILALCLFRVRTHADTTLADVYSDPARFEGRTIQLATEALVVAVDDEGFTLRELGREIRVAGLGGEPGGTVGPDDVGRFVHVRGTFRAGAPEDGALAGARLELVGLRVHRGRRVKIYASLVPLAWVALLLLATFRVDLGRLAVEPRRRA